MACSRPDCIYPEPGRCSDERPSFLCRVRSVNLGFTYGKAEFHGDTVKQRIERQEADIKAAGLEGRVEPVGSRWV